MSARNAALGALVLAALLVGAAVAWPRLIRSDHPSRPGGWIPLSDPGVVLRIHDGARSETYGFGPRDYYYAFDVGPDHAQRLEANVTNGSRLVANSEVSEDLRPERYESGGGFGYEQGDRAQFAFHFAQHGAAERVLGRPIDFGERPGGGVLATLGDLGLTVRWRRDRALVLEVADDRAAGGSTAGSSTAGGPPLVGGTLTLGTRKVAFEQSARGWKAFVPLRALDRLDSWRGLDANVQIDVRRAPSGVTVDVAVQVP